MGERVAFIGLGNMGKYMCANLFKKPGVTSVIVYNRTRKACESLVENLGKDKIVIADTVNDAVKETDVIFICVSDDAACRAIIQSIQCDIRGKLFVDCSTIHPDTTTEILDYLSEKGADFVAAPVFGAAAAAKAARLVFVLAGKKEAVERVKSYTTGIMGRQDIDFGGHPARQGTLLKVIGNAYQMGVAEALGTCFAVAEATGLGSEIMDQFFQTMWPDPGQIPLYSKRMLTDSYYKETLFSVANTRKDDAHALKLAEDHGVDLQITKIVEGHCDIIEKHYGAAGDVAGLYGANRVEAGLPYENVNP